MHRLVMSTFLVQRRCTTHSFVSGSASTLLAVFVEVTASVELFGRSPQMWLAKLYVCLSNVKFILAAF